LNAREPETGRKVVKARQRFAILEGVPRPSTLPARTSWASIHRQGVSVLEPLPMTEAIDTAVRRRALVIEDEMLIGMLLEDMLADLGHEVVAVIPRLDQAIAAVNGDNYDFAILDVHLNGQSALPVADALAERGVPFVFATGYGQRGLPDKFSNRPVLSKPFAKDDLDRVLRQLLP
jgi:CheY-like chemotaxis protein